MSIHRIELDDPRVAAVVIYGDVTDVDDDNLDVHAHLRDGRVLGFTAFTVRNVERALADEPWLASPGMVIVRRLDEAAIVGAVLAGVAADLGVPQRA